MRLLSAPMSSLRAVLASAVATAVLAGGLVLSAATPAAALPCALPTSGSNFAVTSEADLITLSSNADCWAEDIVQTADITLSAPNANIASIGDVNVPFTGTYDGQLHSISGLAITGSDSDRGLFGDILNATIQRLSVAGSITGAGSLGLIGGASSSTIADIISSVDVTGWEFVGGVIGFAEDSTVTRVSASGSVSGAIQGIGGLVGFSQRTTITNSTSSATISGGSITGGAVGIFLSGTATNISASGTVACVSDCGGLIGAVGGTDSSTIDQSFSIGDVPSLDRVGGLIGATAINPGKTLTLTNSYRRGDVTDINGTIAGLIIGRQQFDGQVNISDVYATGVNTGTGITPYAFIGQQVDNTPATITNSFNQAPPNPPDLTSITTFTDAGWDIDENWTTPTGWGICPDFNDGLPFLKAFYDMMGPCSPPQFDSFSPHEGSIYGGDVVTITGSRLHLVTGVTFGNAYSMTMTIVSDTEIICITPPHDAGRVDFAIHYMDGTMTSPDGFLYEVPADPVVPAFTG